MIAYGPAGEADAETLAALHGAAFPRGWSGDEFAGLLGAPGTSALAARRDGDQRPVGFVIARAAAGEAEVLTIVVAAAHRRRGIARSLMRRLFEDLAAHRVGAVFLEVGADNSPALGLYRGLGFVQVGRRPGYYGAGASGDAVVLRAALAAPATVSKGAETDYESPT